MCLVVEVLLLDEFRRGFQPLAFCIYRTCLLLESPMLLVEASHSSFNYVCAPESRNYAVIEVITKIYSIFCNISIKQQPMGELRPKPKHAKYHPVGYMCFDDGADTLNPPLNNTPGTLTPNKGVKTEHPGHG